MLDVAQISRGIPWDITPDEALDKIAWALSTAQQAYQLGQGLPGETTRNNVVGQIAAYKRDLEAGGAPIARRVKDLCTRAAIEFNSVTEGRAAESTNERMLWEDIERNAVEVTSTIVGTTVSITKWIAIAAVAVAAIFYYPEIKILAKGATKWTKK